MRTILLKKRWLWVAAFLVLGAGALFWSVNSVTATTTAPTDLWTNGTAVVPSVSSVWEKVAKQDLPAVVNVSTTAVVKNPMASELEQSPFFQQFFGNVPQNYTEHSLGSGFIIRSDGYIVTNNHVVDHATKIVVKLPDGRSFPAKVVGRDAQTDIALLKIDATGLSIVPLGDSTSLQIGQPVMAIGNPFGLNGTVTTGIISAEGRVIGDSPYDNFLQTDAPINPGNSGGPLVNAAGEVVGINTAIISQSGGSVGIGFAIPIREAKAILPQLAATGHVTRGWLGVGIQRLTPELAKAMHLSSDQGVLVSQVMPDSPAAKAGLQAGDVIVEFNGHKVNRMSELPMLVAETPIGQQAKIQVIRNDKTVDLTARIAEKATTEQVAEKTPQREKLGLSVQPLTPALASQLGLSDQHGLVVMAVKDGSPAADAGIQTGNVIVQVNRKPVQDIPELRAALKAQAKDSPTLFQIHRKDINLFVAVQASGTARG